MKPLTDAVGLGKKEIKLKVKHDENVIWVTNPHTHPQLRKQRKIMLYIAVQNLYSYFIPV